jgi:hypothetical protein
MISGPIRNSAYCAVPLLLFCLLTACCEVCAQVPQATSEIPIERCDPSLRPRPDRRTNRLHLLPWSDSDPGALRRKHQERIARHHRHY